MSFTLRNTSDRTHLKLVLRTGPSVETKMQDRRTGRLPVATSALKPCKQTGTPVDVVSPTRVKRVSSHVETNLGGMLDIGSRKDKCG